VRHNIRYGIVKSERFRLSSDFRFSRLLKKSIKAYDALDRALLAGASPQENRANRRGGAVTRLLRRRPKYKTFRLGEAQI
jgi:hypothetical protein